ncbi:MAG: glycoside hydrolase family 95 protein, partial [Prevotella sp.]|nr:glycoside hydrolase family 95 protein [Prevotella sp.]
MAADNAEKNSNPLKLWYNRPATYWEEALPIGNGRLGAMVYGGIRHEELQLNEETVWTGSPYNNTNPNAKDSLAKIRQLIFEGKNLEAQHICGPAICSPRGNGMAYQTVGSLHLDFNVKGYKADNDTAALKADKKSAYYRDLNISDAVATTRFTLGGVTYTREAFTSFKDNLLIVRLTASKKGMLSFTARFTTSYKENRYRITKDKNLLRLDGMADDHEGVPASVKFTSLLRPSVKGGKTYTTDSAIVVKNATEAILYISIGTNFKNYKDVSGDAYTTALKYLRNSYAIDTEYNRVKDAHTELYKSYFNRVKLNLGEDTNKDKTTDQRIVNYA